MDTRKKSIKKILNKLVLPALLAVVLVFPASMAHAVSPDEKLADPKLEQRARDISAELRCLVCQNQSIDDSNAGLAKDLRLLVRERLTAGDTNSQVMTFVVERYGDFVLLRPPLNMRTLVLWIAPLLLLVSGIVLIKRYNKTSLKLLDEEDRETGAPDGLSEGEETRLKKLLEPDKKG